MRVSWAPLNFLNVKEFMLIPVAHFCEWVYNDFVLLERMRDSIRLLPNFQ